MTHRGAGWYRVVVNGLWLEWLVARLSSTGDGEGVLDACGHVPSWFRLHELGLSFRDGPSIFWTAEHLDEINRAHRAVLSVKRLPKPKRGREQAQAEQRRRDWRAISKVRATARTRAA